MSLDKTTVRQRNFSGGEIDDSAERRDDTELFNAALKRARNGMPLDTGALRRRPGRRIRYFDGGLHDIVRPVAGATFDATFADGRFTARLLNGAVVANIAGCPWTAAMLADLAWEEGGTRIFVAHRDMPPQVLEYNAETGAWSRFAFSFRTGLGGASAEPFYRFADFGETMQPSGRTGSITLTTSADVFEAGHVGVRFTWVGKQVEITAVTHARLATATVIETLPPSFNVTVDSSAGYIVGEIVEGAETGTRAEVISVPDSTHINVVVVSGYNGFADAEKVVGLDGAGTVSGQSGVSPLASVQWEEAFISAVRGYPGSVSTDAQRLIFCDFPQAEQVILWSRVGAPDDFAVTGTADGAIFEFVTQRCRVLYVIGGADEFVVTDRGIFYIPISGDTPLAPGSVEFRRISTDAAAKVRPAIFPDGLIVVGATRTRLISVVGTGQTARPYITRPLTDFHTHLFTEIISIAASDDSTAAGGRRYIYAINADGKAVAGHYDEKADWMGWFPWDGAGALTAVAARYGDVIWSVAYEIGETVIDTVEALDATARMDGMIALVDFVGTDPIQDSEGEAIQDSTGESIFGESGALIPFAGATLDAMSDADFYLGTVVVDEDGSVSIDGEDLAGVEVGFKFPVDVRPLLRTEDDGRLKRRKIGRVTATVRETQVFTADGNTFAGFKAGEDMATARPARNKTYAWRRVGRAYDPEIVIAQDVPGSFTLIEIATQVTV